MGATVGSVIGTQGAIVPAAIGVDIGCGMAAVEFELTASELPDNLDGFLSIVEKTIPAGVGEGHAEVTQAAYKWLGSHSGQFSTKLDQKLTDKLLSQFGSLGSGNHFFEVCLDERDHVWIVLHSGSRGLGNILASRHIKAAKALCDQKNIGLEDKDLAYFEENDDGFNLYISDMLACQDYAAGNRDLMLKRAIQEFKGFIFRDSGRHAKQVQLINCHHNFTQKEVHDGRELWITRKGAIKADEGDLGIIPGSMGTRTYIVEGLGNDLSYHSCSHGAGRVHSRSAAKKLFTKDDLAEAMRGKTWQADKAQSLVDEIPAAYKDIDQVMEDQKDLVVPLHTLRQVLNYKGC
jgi:tRNA-splicing ligase RtcB